MDIQDSIHDCGTPNIPGILTRIHMICECDVETWPELVSTTADGDNLVLEGNIVPVATKGFAKFDIITETGEVKAVMIGTDGSRSFEQVLTGKKANINHLVDAWFAKHANMCAICVAEDKNGQLRVIGWRGVPAKFRTAEGTTGMASGSSREWAFEIYANTGKPAYVYNGTLPLIP